MVNATRVLAEIPPRLKHVPCLSRVVLGFSCRLGPGVWKPNCVRWHFGSRTQRGGTRRQDKPSNIEVSFRRETWLACNNRRCLNVGLTRPLSPPRDLLAAVLVIDHLLCSGNAVCSRQCTFSWVLFGTHAQLGAQVPTPQHGYSVTDQPEQPCRRPPRREPDPGTAPARVPCCNPSHWNPWILLPPAPSAPIGGPIPTFLLPALVRLFVCVPECVCVCPYPNPTLTDWTLSPSDWDGSGWGSTSATPSPAAYLLPE